MDDKSPFRPYGRDLVEFFNSSGWAFFRPSGSSKRSHGVSASRGDANIPAMKSRISLLPVLILGVGVIAIALHAGSHQTANYTTRILALPDHGQGNITMDYIAYDPKTGYVWVPAINVGSVYVVDTGNSSVREISGFATNEVEQGGRKRHQGPSGVSIGDGVVYIGDRADSSVCAIDEQTFARRSVDTSIPLLTA